MKITLPIFHHNDHTDTLKDCGIEYELKDTDTRDVIFYKINAISEHIDNDNKYSSIHSNGSEYICKLSINELEKKIDDANGKGIK